MVFKASIIVTFIWGKTSVYSGIEHDTRTNKVIARGLIKSIKWPAQIVTITYYDRRGKLCYIAHTEITLSGKRQ